MNNEREVDQATDLIGGAQKVREYFGQWPSFHDAEILDLHLDRANSSWLRVYTAIDGFHPEQRTGTVIFRFKEVIDLELYDFSCQNVVSSIVFKKTAKGFKVSCVPCFGLGGWLEVSDISVELVV